MKQDEIEAAFWKTNDEWVAEREHGVDLISARFFFMQGAAFGTKATAAVYAEEFGTEEIEGVAVRAQNK